MLIVDKPPGILGTKVAKDYKNKLGKNKMYLWRIGSMQWKIVIII